MRDALFKKGRKERKKAKAVHFAPANSVLMKQWLPSVASLAVGFRPKHIPGGIEVMSW